MLAAKKLRKLQASNPSTRDKKKAQKSASPKKSDHIQALQDSLDPHTKNLLAGLAAQLKSGSDDAKPKAESTHSSLGPNFVKFFEDLKMDLQVPHVEVCFKLLCISSVSPLEHSFACEFIVMFDWQDPSIVLMKKKDVNIDEHFTPNIDFDNCTSREFVGGSSSPRIKDHKEGRVTLTQRILGQMRTRFDMAMFPFDSQILEIRLKSRHATRNKESLYVKLCNPETWRFKNGHKLGASADWLSEWDIVKFDGAPDGKHQDEYRLQITILRDSRAAFWRLIFSLSSILLLSFTAFGVQVDDLSDRASITMTMMLALVAFKFILADELPKVPYLTVMDKFIVAALCTLIIQGLVFWVVADVDRWGHVDIAGYRMTADCLDAAFLKTLILVQLAVHAWLAKCMRASTVDVMRQTKMFCKITPPKKQKDEHNKLADELRNTESLEVYNSPEFCRPYKQKPLIPVVTPRSLLIRISSMY